MYALDCSQEPASICLHLYIGNHAGEQTGREATINQPGEVMFSSFVSSYNKGGQGGLAVKSLTSQTHGIRGRLQSSHSLTLA